MLVNNELGKVDYSKLHEQQVNSATKAVLDLVQTETLRFWDPPPILGNSCNTDKTWEAVKMLKRELGLCDIEKEDSTHLTKYLKRLYPIITENQLSERAAYELLTSVTEGLINSFVGSRRDSKIPFVKLWKLLSATCPPVVPLQKVTQEDDELLKKGPQDPNILLKEIAALWESTSNGDDELRKRIVEESAIFSM
jgi:hypothetical protein